MQVNAKPMAAPGDGAPGSADPVLTKVNNSPSPARFTTSFDAIDATVAWMRASHTASLERVSLVGFSAGAQLLSRWAFFSSVATAGANVTAVVSDPSSYMYLDGRRPASACSSLRDTGPAHFCTTFAAPDAAACPGFDNYKYGLTDLSDSKAESDRLGGATAMARWLACWGCPPRLPVAPRT